MSKNKTQTISVTTLVKSYYKILLFNDLHSYITNHPVTPSCYSPRSILLQKYGE